jgi:glycolate oxidase FAD binding subunit
VQYPESSGQLAEALLRAAGHERTISREGTGTKRQMAGPIHRADEWISTARLNRVLQYEPHDLTVSVEAGLPWADFTRLLAENRQMVPLDPPFADHATVGGVVASNSSGPRRRLYGTARDMVIGMTFATLEGKLVQSGGMVVKNVAGLDMAKLMIGSFGTLAAIASVNFKVTPIPEVERSFLLPFPSGADAIAARDRILNSALQPAAIDLLNPAAGAGVGNRSWLLGVRAAGNTAAVERYEREVAPMAGGVALEGQQQDALWRYVQEFTLGFLAQYPEGAVVRVSCTLKEVGAAAMQFDGPAVARAGSGVCYGYFEDAASAGRWAAEAAGRGVKAAVEFSPERLRRKLDLWPAAGADWEIMKRVKQLFDPGNVLNRGRLYGRI